MGLRTRCYPRAGHRLDLWSTSGGCRCDQAQERAPFLTVQLHGTTLWHLRETKPLCEPLRTSQDGQTALDARQVASGPFSSSDLVMEQEKSLSSVLLTTSSSKAALSRFNTLHHLFLLVAENSFPLHQ